MPWTGPRSMARCTGSLAKSGICSSSETADNSACRQRSRHSSGSRESGNVTRAAKDFSGTRAGHFALIDDRHAIDQHVVHSLRELIRIIKSSEVADRRGIENRDVGPHPDAKQTAALEAQALGGKRREFADGIFERELVLFANVFA